MSHAFGLRAPGGWVGLRRQRPCDSRHRVQEMRPLDRILLWGSSGAAASTQEEDGVPAAAPLPLLWGAVSPGISGSLKQDVFRSAGSRGVPECAGRVPIVLLLPWPPGGWAYPFIHTQPEVARAPGPMSQARSHRAVLTSVPPCPVSGLSPLSSVSVFGCTDRLSEAGC